MQKISYSGQSKINICENLVYDWPKLADYLEISPSERAGFEHGRGPQRVWEWLEQHGKLGKLKEALQAIGRDDLVPLLHESPQTRPQQQSGKTITKSATRPLPVDVQRRLLAFLTSLPNMQTREAQQALITMAAFDLGLIGQISFGLPAAQFFPLLLSLLRQYGSLEGGRDPLVALLEAAQALGLVGTSRQAECDALIAAL